jgi:SAM-dependent methyltransferase
MNSFPYATADYETVPCNLCNGSEVEVIARRDRNGLPVQSCLCKHCGLIFISPRMTAKWYGEYYRDEYRAQMSRFKGEPPRQPDYEGMFASSTRHGVALAEEFRAECLPGLTLEVGSSVGGVLNGFRRVLGVDVVGIEPSPGESAFANERGIQTFPALIEQFREPIPPAANVICTQSLNHLLDPRFFLRWAHERLATEGRLLLEVMNFRHVFAQFGWMPRAIQVDHTYMFVPEVLRAFVEAAGFDLLRMTSLENATKQEIKAARRKGLPIYHTSLVAKKSARTPFSGPIPNQSEAVAASLRSLPDSALVYFWRDGFRKWRRRMLARVRS